MAAENAATKLAAPAPGARGRTTGPFRGFGPGIRRLRSALDWTQAELSDRSGVKAETISGIETGSLQSVTLWTLGSLLDALDASLGDLELAIDPSRPAAASDELAAEVRALTTLVRSRLERGEP